MASNIRLIGKWKLFQTLLNFQAFNSRIRGEMRRATRTNASIVKREIRLNLRGGPHTPNANLTTFIKGSSKPGIDNAQLFKSVAFRSIDAFTAEIGVLKKAPGANLAIVFHEGATIPVTPAMRGMFAALSDASLGKRDAGSLRGRAAELFNRRTEGWVALRPSTTAIIIKGRPFIREVIERRELGQALAENWLAAAGAAVAGRRARLKTSV